MPTGPDAVDPTPRLLPTPPAPAPSGAPDRAVLDWVATALGDLVDRPVTGSGRFRGGQRAADAALSATDLAGYAARRNEVAPPDRRGATGLSPWVRHGLLDLPRLWRAAADAPAADRDRFRDELLWQEYARHLRARLGPRTARALRFERSGGRTAMHTTLHPTSDAASETDTTPDPWRRARTAGMRCVETTLDELERDGWIVNQTRMWLASQWAVREGADWRAGEDALFRELVDGSRAANRLGWQWVAGTATGRPYGFSREQVERRAPGTCRSCTLADACPIEHWADDPELVAVEREPLLRDDPDPAATAGPRQVERDDEPTAVWLTAESLGDADPALTARADLPAVFVFDVPLLSRLALAPRRLVFLAECLGDLATRRAVEVWRGDVVAALDGRALAVTHAPVPGFRRRAAALDVVERHPWPWLRRPASGPLGSFSAWRGSADGSGDRSGARSRTRSARR